jgi:hypothetical protein
MVERLTKPEPVAGATLKRPDGSIFMELPEVPFNASEEATKPVEEQRVIDPETGYFGKKIEQLNQG